MKKYLIRSGITPLQTFTPAEMIVRNSIGGNVGNLVYAYSVYRTLMTDDDVTFDADNYHINPDRADYINENYDAYIIPLADAFRSDFISSMKKYTKLIKKLKIPVYIIGVGLRTTFEPKPDDKFEFDDVVRDFIKAVLEKSTMVGVRGQITADYLSRLGFREGKDHMAIGCPSMYSFGRELTIRDTTITPESMVTVNSSRLSPKNVLDFITRSMDEFPDHYFIPQWLKEMRLTYIGFPNIPKIEHNNYPGKITDDVYVNNRVRYFLNVPTWLDFLKQADFSFGARLHGNIAATIAGTPSLLIPKDGRMRELTEYHHLTHIWAKDIDDNTNIWDVIEKLDFHEVSKYQGANFDRYIDFLNTNKIDHIYKNGNDPARVPLDDAIAKVNLQPPIQSIASCDVQEAIKRFETLTTLEQQAKAKKGNSKDKEQYHNILAEKDKQIKYLQGTLNRKSVRTALKVANMFASKK
ncbi:polysaccharide pyruvyl transferase family protein [Rummeliibacillus sp. TYF005]|uniref:polysaccharide pyruvyl transferase family protein n=1 Tax=Rummeliibacillus sp. TYF005 TaxID=2058214 RepID=UPI000F52C068|nr:polysaccharide pyruvyl transferase family protein [Rummeliibacillus sp. TYF005]RPJ96504.1 polysaccharide pyruvyl transferase family protein [Rummeliibacillus sp. TYF005]